MIGVTGNSPVDGVMRVYRGKWGEMGTYSMIKSTIYDICLYVYSRKYNIIVLLMQMRLSTYAV